MTKDVGVFVGYRLSSSGYSNVTGFAETTTHTTPTSVSSFAKALSLTRKTTASFGTGTSAVTDGNETRYTLTGNVQIMRELGRTWSASV